MNRKKLWVVSVVAALILTAYAGAVQAGESNEAAGWEFAIVPYLWGLSLDGSVTVKGQETDVDLSSGDVVGILNVALMFDFEVRKGRVGGFINPLFAQLDRDQSVAGLKIDTAVDMFMSERLRAPQPLAVAQPETFKKG